MTFSNLVSLHGRRAGIAPAVNGGGLVILRDDGSQEAFGCYKYATITSAQLLALFATPITVLAAPGAGLAYAIRRVVIHKPAGTAYAGIAAGEDLVLKYTDASGAQISSAIETTGFLDSASATTAIAGPPAGTGSTAGSHLLVADAAVVLHLLTAEIITGTSALHLHIYYDVLKTAFTS